MIDKSARVPAAKWRGVRFIQSTKSVDSGSNSIKI